MWVGSDLFCATYTHLSTLLVFLRSVLSGYASHFSQEDLDRIFVGELEVDQFLFMGPTLFCICIAFGSDSLVGLRGQKKPPKHQCVRLMIVSFLRFSIIPSPTYQVLYSSKHLFVPGYPCHNGLYNVYMETVHHERGLHRVASG